MTYIVYIRWETSDGFILPLKVEAESHAEAAQKRIDRLYDPSGYDEVLVINVTADLDEVTGQVFRLVPPVNEYRVERTH